MNTNIENEIQTAVKAGDPFALDGLTEKLCADEYRRRLGTMPRALMLELDRRFYENPSDANKDWLLGEVVENIEANTDWTRSRDFSR
jgi:hypothetical protein